MIPWSKTYSRFIGAVLILSGLAACESNPKNNESPTPPKSAIHFLDFPGFDRDLAGSLESLPKVEVAFYERLGPSALPERLQAWLASVESGGGRVTVTPPKGSVAPKDPFLLISAISALWSASKVAKELSAKSQYLAVRGYDATIVLKSDPSEGSVLDKIVFVRRSN